MSLIVQNTQKIAQQFLTKFQNLSISPNRRIGITITISAISIGAISIAISYYYRIYSLKSNNNNNRTLSKSRHLIEMIPELKRKSVKMKNPDYVELILSNLIHGGPQRLQVISDFDRTLSTCTYNGKVSLTSNGNFQLTI
jgi:hypothetical protein